MKSKRRFVYSLKKEKKGENPPEMFQKYVKEHLKLQGQIDGGCVGTAITN